MWICNILEKKIENKGEHKGNVGDGMLEITFSLDMLEISIVMVCIVV